jgi:low affinity Fe/Cu permease
LSWFVRVSRWLSTAAGTWQAFTLALGSVLIWFICGFWAGFTDPLFQLSINTGTTIVTFLMLFLLQGSQNRDTAAIHVKLDELIRATAAARNSLLAAERFSDEELAQLKALFTSLADKDAH